MALHHKALRLKKKRQRARWPPLPFTHTHEGRRIGSRLSYPGDEATDRRKRKQISASLIRVSLQRTSRRKVPSWLPDWSKKSAWSYLQQNRPRSRRWADESTGWWIDGRVGREIDGLNFDGYKEISRCCKLSRTAVTATTAFITISFREEPEAFTRNLEIKWRNRVKTYWFRGLGFNEGISPESSTANESTACSWDFKTYYGWIHYECVSIKNIELKVSVQRSF